MLNSGLIKGKNILLRADLDVPTRGGKVDNDFRLRAILPTLNFCLEHAKEVRIIGHLGRPNGPDPAFSLNPVREWLERAMNRPISLISSGFSPGEWARGFGNLSMLENLRFAKGELDNDREFAIQLTAGANIYIYEAFAAYNPAASLQRIPEIIPTYPGFRFEKEIEALKNIVENHVSPSLLILSGAKEDKLPFVDKLVDKFDHIFIGGRLATLVPISATVTPASLTPDGFDINSASINLLTHEISKASRVVINGPLGRFEDGEHVSGTRLVLQAAADSPAYSLIGGGDTINALPSLGFNYDDFSFVSTGGGAMLEYLSTSTHPLLEVIKKQTYAPNS